MAGILIVDQIQNSSNTLLINSGALAANTVGTSQIQSGITLTNPIVSGNINSGSATALTLQTANTNAITIDASQNVGIGVTPAQKLDVQTSAGRFQVVPLGGSSVSLYNGTSGGNIALDSSGGITLFKQNGTESMRITSNGQVGWGVTPSSIDGWLTLTWHGQSYVGFVMNNLDSSGSSANFRFKNNGTTVGEITSTSSATTYTTSSDYRLKENVAPMTGALSKVALLKPVTYTWKNSGVESQGFIAHELQEVIPDAVVGEKDALNEDGSIKPQGIDTSFLVATLTAAIQEQQAIITQQAADIAALKAKVGI